MADPYWVSPTGEETWANAQSATPLSGVDCCSMATMNSSIDAGDTAYLRAGTYATAIVPSNSGSDGSRITIEAHTDETPTVTVSSRGFTLNGSKSYITIDGITFQDCSAWGGIINNSHYNEIANCTFDHTGWVGGDKGIYVYTGGGDPCTHNWFHHNTFSRNAYDPSGCNDEGGHIWIGVVGYGNADNYNTIEDNVFSYGGHHLIEVWGKYNIIRNNVFHNEGWMTGSCSWGPSARNSKYGHRCINIEDGGSNSEMFNLLENNRIGHSAFTFASGMDGNIVLTAPGNIVRFNYSYYSETMGLYFKNRAASAQGNNNRVYNNTLYYNGQDSQLYPDEWTGWGDLDWRYSIIAGSGTSGNILKNNIIYDGYNDDFTGSGSYTATNNWVTTDGDPKFVNTDVSDPTSSTLPDLELRNDSPCLNGGTYLTQANGSGSDSTTLIVDDVLYFQDGSWGSGLSNITADYIAIGTIGNTVQISSIDYATNTITLSSAMTWDDEDPIWLYKDSDGTVVLYGTAPNYGAGQERAAAFNTSIIVGFE